MKFFYHPSIPDGYILPDLGGQVLDISLGKAIGVGDRLLEQSVFCFQSTCGKNRKVSIPRPTKQASFLSIAVQADAPEVGRASADGYISAEVYLYIIRLLSIPPNDQKIDSYLSLIIHSLRQTPAVRPTSIPFFFLQQTYAYVLQEQQKSANKKLTMPADRKRFQLACRFLFDSTFKELTQEFALRTAYHSIKYSELTFESIYQTAGYHHLPSFKRAFRLRFGIAPSQLRGNN